MKVRSFFHDNRGRRGGKFQSGRGYRGKGGRFGQNNQNRPQGLLYGNYDHVAMKCFHCFQQEYYSQTQGTQNNATGNQPHSLITQP